MNKRGRKAKPILPRQCAWCAQEFVPKDKRSRVCSRKCSGALVAKELGHASDFECLRCHAICCISTVASGQLTNRKKGEISQWRKRRGLSVVSFARQNQLQQYENARLRNALQWAWDSEWSAIPQGEDMQHWWEDEDVKRSMAMVYYYRNHAASKDRAALYAKNRYYRTRHAPEVRIKRAVRNAISRICRNYQGRKTLRTCRYLGCTMDEAKRHIERLFVKGMTWANHGIAWEIDHIIPLSSFDLTRQDEMLRANNILNLQPLWKRDNRSKGARILGNHQLALL